MSNQSPNEALEVNLKWPLEDGLQAVYANQFAIAGAGPEIIIVFGEFLPVGLVNRSKEEVADYLQRATVKPVAKIVVSPAGLEAFYSLLRGYMDQRTPGQ